jgi:Zn-dependent protease with chaperone function
VTQDIAADYFDGRSARAHAVRLRLDGVLLVIEGDGVDRSVPCTEVVWPERTRHGVRVAHLRDGASIQCHDSAAWDAWTRSGGRGESLVVKAQQNWRGVVACLVVLVAALVAAYQWGLPWAARQAVAVVPQTVDETIGESAFASIDEHLMSPSRLPPEQQARISAAFERAVATLPAGTVPPHRLLFRKSAIGPNAFALPGGTMVLTDELVTLVKGDEAVIVGVLGHELGHLRQRHGMRMLAQVSALGAVSAALFGDFNSLLAAAPVWLGQASYSRDAEREADAESVGLMKSAGISPEVMVRFFEAVAAYVPPDESAAKESGKQASGASSSPKPDAREARNRRQASWLGIAIASHPADEERIRFFKEAASRRSDGGVD